MTIYLPVLYLFSVAFLVFAGLALVERLGKRE